MATLKRPETLVEAVANHVRSAIIAGDYEPGAGLPEVRLAAELGTSRGTIREALRTLTDDGLVEIVPHRGSFVSTITAKKVAELYDLRAVLEPLAVGLAKDRGAFGEPETRENAARLLELMGEAAGHEDSVGMVTAERELHKVLWWPCGNELLREFLSHLLTQTRRVIVYTRPIAKGLQQDYDDHRALLATVLDGTRGEAVAAVKNHTTRSKRLILGKISEREREVKRSSAADLVIEDRAQRSGPAGARARP